MADTNDKPKKKENPSSEGRGSLFDKFLNGIEAAGNKLPDPAMLFFLLLVIVWVLSALLSPIDFGEVHPRTGDELVINNLLTGDNLASFLANMIDTFVLFAPLGIVLVDRKSVV